MTTSNDTMTADAALRDEFAKVVLAAALAQGQLLAERLHLTCVDCWAVADAMMAARNGGQA